MGSVFDGCVVLGLSFGCCISDPVPADSLWQREGMDGEEAHVSPHAGGRLIQELLGEDNDPMLSPRSYGYGYCRQYLDDTEVPPSPPNAHSFMRWVCVCVCTRVCVYA